MLVANVSRTWPSVMTEDRTAEESVLGDWAALNEAKLHQYADAILGVADGTVVAAYDIDRWERLENGRVRFQGQRSARWARFIGSPSPVTWTQGAARPIRYLATEELAAQSVNHPSTSQRDRHTIRGWTLHVTPDGNAILHLPVGRSLTVVTTEPSARD